MGQVINMTKDGITFAGKTIEAAREDFRGAVDDYLEWAKQDNVDPEPPQKNIEHGKTKYGQDFWTVPVPRPVLPILQEIVNERKRQDGIWGEQNHTPEEWLLILGEEFGEVCRSAVTMKWGGGPYTRHEYRRELI